MAEKSDHDLLTEINVKIDFFTKEFLEHIADDKKIQGEQNIRLTNVEKQVWRWMGAIAILVLLLNILGTGIAKAMFK